MEADETVEITVKVRVPGEPIQWLYRNSEGFDLVRDHGQATRFGSMDEAFDIIESLDPEWPDASLSVIEEGWSGDWPEEAISPLHAAFWRHQ